MSTQPHPGISPEEYLAAERQSETRSEYFGGEVVAMTGASRKHNLIVTNLILALGPQVRRRTCEIYPGDMRVKVTRTGSYVYPDAVIACGKPEFEDANVDTLINPTVVFEVLSASTEQYDRGRKWELYRRIPSLSEYLMISQEATRVEQYVRQQSGLWLFAELTEEGDAIELPTVQCTLALRDLYDRVF